VLTYRNVNVVNANRFAVVATVDAPRDHHAVGHGRQPGGRGAYTITLNRGQTYQTHSNPSPSDLTGTLITSDQPISVFGGHRANIPQGHTFCDHLVEQLPPVET
jgi:hypothetical protein